MPENTVTFGKRHAVLLPDFREGSETVLADCNIRAATATANRYKVNMHDLFIQNHIAAICCIHASTVNQNKPLQEQTVGCKGQNAND